MATSNVIQVTACDNQLLIFATQWGYSYQIANIASGNSNPVDVTITIEEGNWTQGYSGNNVLGGPLPSTATVYLPSSDKPYALNCIGINWGGPFQVDFTVNGKKYGSGKLNNNPDPDVGILWSTGSKPIQITVQ